MAAITWRVFRAIPINRDIVGRRFFSHASSERFALISVSDKRGLAEFASSLVKDHGYQILSTGGTAKLFLEKGIPVTEVSKFTGFPEILDGRVKSLHPKIHGGLLAKRDKPEHLKELEKHGMKLIDLVVVNLYPFQETVAKEGVTLAQAIENIDIGGPSMLRSASKNFQSVTVVCDPNDYEKVLEHLKKEKEYKKSDELLRFRQELAAKVFAFTAQYDNAIGKYLTKTFTDKKESVTSFPDTLTLKLSKTQDLRYGENPHQKAALYELKGDLDGNFSSRFAQLQGKELSYNNIIDIQAASQLIDEFEYELPTIAILKHTNPCGVATGPSLVDAWNRAFETDKQAPFGGIIIANKPLDGKTANEIGKIFCEVIIAPDFLPDALSVLTKKKNLRLMKYKKSDQTKRIELRSVGGVLVQDQDVHLGSKGDFKVVTRRHPTPEEWETLLFGWKVVKHVKSNAIVYAGRDETGTSRTLGVGAGQMSRVDSSKLAVWKAHEAGLQEVLKSSVIASDAFFPFPDGLLAAADAGAKAVIQPGGSVRDKEVIEAADSRNMAMVFTSVRHFKH